MRKYVFEQWGVIFVGPAGSGKTYKALREYHGLKRISADDVRLELFDYDNTGIHYVEEREPEIQKIVWDKFNKICNSLASFYWDSTNLTKEIRGRIIKPARKKNYKIKIIYFDLSLSHILMRNSNRKREVSDRVIAGQYHIMEPPEKKEYDELEVVRS